MKTVFYAAAIAVAMVSCKSQEIPLRSALTKEVSRNEVTGLNGWTFNQRIKFGEFTSGKVKRSWNSSWEVPWIIGEKSAKNSHRFVLYNTTADSAELYVEARAIKESEYINLIESRFRIELEYNDLFTAHIAGNNNFEADLILVNPHKEYNRKSYGFIQTPENRYDLEEVFMEVSFIAPVFAGYEVYKDGISVMVINSTDSPSVYFAPELSTSEKHVLASAAAAILLRQNLEN